MSQRDIAKSVKAQDFDSCISLVRVQLSLPRTSHPFGWLFSFVAGIVPTQAQAPQGALVRIRDVSRRGACLFLFSLLSKNLYVKRGEMLGSLAANGDSGDTVRKHHNGGLPEAVIV